MANTKSAIKAIRVSGRKAKINLRKRNQMKDAKKAVKKAIASKDKKLATELLPKAYKEIDKAAKMNIIHKNTAARHKSGLTARVKALD